MSGENFEIILDSAIPKGTTKRVTTNATDSGDLGSEEANNSATISAMGKTGRFLANIIPNPMGEFATFNVLWTLASLTPKQFNNPELYRNAVGLSFGQFETSEVIDTDLATGTETNATLRSGIVFSSAGRGTRVNTAFGTPEYFITKFEMAAVIAANTKTGNQNAIAFTFEIYEPYSMGLLLQSLQNAAAKAGYVNYLDCPFLLKMDIVGNDESGTVKSSIKPKYFVIKLRKASFTVNETGSTYAMEAYPFNQQGFSDTIDTIFSDINISVTTDSGSDPTQNADERGTVRDLLATGKNSLVALLNKQEELNVAQGRYGIKDVYEIHFPESADKRFSTIADASASETQGATTNNNSSITGTAQGKAGTETTTAKQIGNSPIAKSTFGFDVGKGGNFPFKLDKDTVDERTQRVKRGSMQIDVKSRSFHFTQGQKISDIITNVILSSTWAKQQALKGSDANGMKDWFKIDVQVELLKFDVAVGDWAKKYIFRVIPFKVHSTVFDNPNATPVGYDNVQNTIVKKYDFIYTGQNTEVLDFKIDLNYLFYSGISPKPEDKTKNEANTDNKGTEIKKGSKTKVNDSGNEKNQATLHKTKVKKNRGQLMSMVGGSGSTDIEQKIAENFYDAFVNLSSADLVSIEITIMGDPYWMIDSGLSNYFAKQSEQSPLITEDGTASYEGQDIFIYINFRTPADINERTGLVEFSYNDRVSPFSGIYRVTKCLNVFVDGKFTQTLNAVRMRSQPLDFGDSNNQTTRNNASITLIGPNESQDLTATEGSF